MPSVLLESFHFCFIVLQAERGINNKALHMTQELSAWIIRVMWFYLACLFWGDLGEVTLEDNFLMVKNKHKKSTYFV